MKKYYGVIYLTTGETCVKCFSSEEICIKSMKEVVKRNPSLIRATTYMCREINKDSQFLFGNPKTRDLMRNKKFLKSITN